MHTLRSFILLFVVVLLTIAGTTSFAATTIDSLPFPASWTGSWSGTLNLFYSSGKTMSVAMMVEIFPIDTSQEGRYTFGIVYSSKAQDWRPYELVPVDPAKGVWQVDEKNSIVMGSYLCGPKLLCWFVVQGSRILCTYEKTSDTEIVFEVCSGKETAISATGKTKQGKENIPEVLTYPVAVFQRAVLKRGE